MAVPILSSVPLVRVRYIRTRNNVALSNLGLTATPTVSRLNVPAQHGFIDLEPVTSRVDSDTGVGYLDLVVTDDPEVNEDFGWVITGSGWTGFSRTVAVPQTGPIVETLVIDGVDVLAVWLNKLADFTGVSGPTGSEAATRTYVDDSIVLLQATPDPFPQYRLDTDPGGDVVPDATTTVKGQAVILGGTAANPTVPYGKVTGTPTSLPPSGGAGGVLAGSYPNPGFAQDMASQTELDAVAAAKQNADPDLTTIAALDSAQSGTIASDGSGWLRKTYAQLKTALGLVKADVGLGAVDNTADTAKPVSTAQQIALDGKVGSFDARLTNARAWTLYDNTTAPTTGQAPVWNGTTYAPGTVSGGVAGKDSRLLQQGQQLGGGLRPGIFYSSAGSASSSTPAVGAMHVVPFYVPRPCTVSGLGLWVNTGAAGATLRLGIYADIDDEYGGYPGALLVDGGAADATTNNTFAGVTVTASIAPGLVWLAAVAQGASPNVAAIGGPNQTVGLESGGNLASRVGYQQGGVTGTLPAAFANSYNAQGGAPQVQITTSA